MKEDNVKAIKKEIQMVEIIVNQGRNNKKYRIKDLHNDSYYATMCLYHMSLRKALDYIEKNKKITYH